jgi:hypothetical protein
LGTRGKCWTGRLGPPYIIVNLTSAADGVTRSIGIASGEDGVDVEHPRLSIRGQKYPPTPHPDPIITFQSAGQGAHARVEERSLCFFEVVQGFLDPSPSGFVEREILLLG